MLGVLFTSYFIQFGVDVVDIMAELNCPNALLSEERKLIRVW